MQQTFVLVGDEYRIKVGRIVEGWNQLYTFAKGREQQQFECLHAVHKLVTSSSSPSDNLQALHFFLARF
jgi:hypothetical protein